MAHTPHSQLRLAGLLMGITCLSSCTHEFAFSEQFCIRDRDGAPINNAFVCIGSDSMYPIPLPWLRSAWYTTLQLQDSTQYRSNAQGICQFSIPSHRTFYEAEHFYAVISKPGYCTTIIPISELKQTAVILYKSEHIHAHKPPHLHLQRDAGTHPYIYLPKGFDADDTLLFYPPLPRRKAGL